MDVSVFGLQVGGHIETTTPAELHKALTDQDARLRADLSGVKHGELWLNGPAAGITGLGTQVCTFGGGPPQAPAGGYLWAIMNIGVELALASQVRIYKGQPAHYAVGGFAPDGSGRVVATMSNFITPSFQFSKGQLKMRAGEFITLIGVTAAANILNVFISYIEVPEEQQGKLWL